MKPPTEHQEQVAVVNWLDFIAALRWSDLAILDRWSFDESKYAQSRPQFQIPYYSVPNGGKRHIKTAVDLKKEGASSGVADLVLPIPRGGYPGLYIEMKKVKDGTTSKAQKAWGVALRKMGYHWEVCKGHQQAIDSITDYLNMGGKS